MKPFLLAIAVFAILMFAVPGEATAQQGVVCVNGSCGTGVHVAWGGSVVHRPFFRSRLAYYQAAQMPQGQPMPAQYMPGGGSIRGPWMAASGIKTYYSRRGLLSWVFGANVTRITY